jgi:hypothetical protein
LTSHPDRGAEVGERVEAEAVLQCIDFGREEHQGQDDDQEENRGDNREPRKGPIRRRRRSTGRSSGCWIRVVD